MEMNFLKNISVVLLILSMGLGLIRMFRGPHILDRVLSVDFLAIAGISVMAFMTFYMQEPMLLDISLVLALIGFVTALAFGQYLSWRTRK